MPTATRSSTEQLLEIEFHAPDTGLSAASLAALLLSLDDVASVFERIEYDVFQAYYPAETAKRMREGRVDTIAPLQILTLSLGSPLRILASVAGISGRSFDALLNFLKGILFYEEERSRLEAEVALKWQERDRLEAEAALIWEKVRTAQMENAKTAVKLFRGLNTDRGQSEVDRLVEASIRIERSSATLKSVKLKKE